MTTDMEARSRKDRLLLLALTTYGPRLSITGLGKALHKRQCVIYAVCRRLEREGCITFDLPKGSNIWFVTPTQAGRDMVP